MVAGDTMLLQQTINELQRKGFKTATYLYMCFCGYENPLDGYIDEHSVCKVYYSWNVTALEIAEKRARKPPDQLDVLIIVIVFSYGW